MTTVRPRTEMRLVMPTQFVELDITSLQGLWTAEMYLRLSEQTNQLIEFTDGIVETLDIPTRHHQVMLLFIYDLLRTALRPYGKVLVAPMRLQLRPDKYREPDVLLLLDVNDPRNQNAYWLGADLVVEIVSPNDPERDTIIKRADYAEAAIPEYWIINPIDETVTVLILEQTTYREHGVFRRGEQATSLRITDFSIDVDAIFDAK
jgi:Uma2 family endonuclease